ncbi:hypothetical protein LXL04_023933 [Taraxacum kok-saghyz]
MPYIQKHVKGPKWLMFSAASAALHLENSSLHIPSNDDLQRDMAESEETPGLTGHHLLLLTHQRADLKRCMLCQGIFRKLLEGVQSHLRIQRGKFVINVGVMTLRGLYGVLNVIEEDTVMNVSPRGILTFQLKKFIEFVQHVEVAVIARCVYMGKIREIAAQEKLEHLFCLLSSMLPVIKQIHFEQCSELELERKLRDVRKALRDSKTDGGQEKDTNTPEKHDNLLAQKTRLLSNKLCDWKANNDGSIPCPPKEHGGCGNPNSPLILKRIFQMNWVAKLVKNVDEMVMVSGCKNYEIVPENGLMSGGLCLDVKSEGIGGFKKNWVKGQPVVVEGVCDESSMLGWDPMVMWKGIQETNDENMKDDNRTMKAIDSIAGRFEEGGGFKTDDGLPIVESGDFSQVSFTNEFKFKIDDCLLKASGVLISSIDGSSSETSSGTFTDSLASSSKSFLRFIFGSVNSRFRMEEGDRIDWQQVKLTTESSAEVAILPISDEHLQIDEKITSPSWPSSIIGAAEGLFTCHTYAFPSLEPLRIWPASGLNFDCEFIHNDKAIGGVALLSCTNSKAPISLNLEESSAKHGRFRTVE